MVQLKGNLILAGNETTCPLGVTRNKIEFYANNPKLHIEK